MEENHKIKKREPGYKQKLINRLKRIDGQINGIIRMVENDAYCPDILMQTSAVNSAINSFNKDLIAGHIRSCVLNDIKDGHEEVVDELVITLQKLMK